MELALKTLKQIGLTENEAQIYIYLTRKGPCSKKQLAKIIGLTDQPLVDSLKSLNDKGFVTPVESTYTMFLAVPLERILDGLEKKKLDEVECLKKVWSK